MNLNRNLQLYTRMGLTMFGLVGLYIIFLGVLSQYFTSIVPVLFIAGIFLFAQYFLSDKLALRSANAKIVSQEEFPDLHNRIERLSMQADIEKPKVAVSTAPMANAFAAGRSPKNSVVCVTEELLSLLDDDELDAVLAHELAHVKNRDVLVMTIASFFSTLAFFIFRYGIYGGSRNKGVIVSVIVSLVVWISSTLLLRLLSRYREYTADRGATAITGNPLALASALSKITGINETKPTDDLREHAGMNAFYIMNVNGGKLQNLFSTHPQPEERIQKLKDMSAEQHNQT